MAKASLGLVSGGKRMVFVENVHRGLNALEIGFRGLRAMKPMYLDRSQAREGSALKKSSL